jgi:pyruvate dehydrogenase E1 component
MVEKMSDNDIWQLRRGGHDPQKVYAAYAAAVKHSGEPTVLLVKTVKGWGMGKAGEGKNTAHQTKKLSDDDIKATCATASTFPVPDSETAQDIPFYKPADDTPEMKLPARATSRRWAVTCRKRRTRADEQLHGAGAGHFQERDGAHR